MYNKYNVNNNLSTINHTLDKEIKKKNNSNLKSLISNK